MVQKKPASHSSRMGERAEPCATTSATDVRASVTAAGCLPTSGPRLTGVGAPVARKVGQMSAHSRYAGPWALSTPCGSAAAAGMWLMDLLPPFSPRPEATTNITEPHFQIH